jgi:hypothetical protein
MLKALGALSLARPAALWIGLALIPVVVLYFLRMRFRRKSVGSTFLWRELAEATSGGDALKRRSILLLLLQATAVALAAFAASGPSLVSRVLLEPGVAFVIDVSASMGSRDCAGPRGPRTMSRVEAAVEAASREIDALGGGTPIMTFACSVSATMLLPAPTLDKAAAKASLRGLSAGSGGFEEGACADAISAWLSRAGGAWRARAFTDGGMDLGGERLAAAFGGSFGSVALGTSGDSVGATGLRLEEVGGGKARAVFTLWNGHARAEELRLRLARDKKTIASALLRAEPGWSRSSLDLGAGMEEGGYALEIQRGRGELEGGPGEACYLSVARRPALRVLLVGRSDPFLKAALAQGGISYSSLAEFPPYLAGKEAGTAKGPDGSAAPDIVVVEAASVPAGTRCNLLVFGAPPSDAPIAPSGAVAGAIAGAAGTHPLSRFVSWDGAKASAGMGYALRGQALVLATTGGVPSVVAWEKDGYRCLACGIDLARSDLGLKSAFPVLLQNYLQWCAPRADDQSAYTLFVGESARRLEPESFRIGGGGVEATRSGPAVEISARSAGLFEWEASGARGYIAANVPAGELDAAPRPLRAGGEAGSGAAAAASTPVLAAEERESSRPLGAAAAALLAVCLAAEWIAWNGRARRRGAKAGKPTREGGTA